MRFFEDARELPVLYDGYDIVVCGGGTGGIAAALAAAREGKRVLLIERMFALGGLATLGLITIYLPLCDGRGRLVSTGIAEELFKLSISRGWEDEYPGTWLKRAPVNTSSASPRYSFTTTESNDHGSQRYRVRYNANVFAILAEQLLKAEGVEILYGTTVCGVFTEGKQVKALIVENKSGRSAVPAAGFIDACGDADLFALAGAKTVNYSEGNKPAAWFYETAGGTNNLRILGVSDVQPENNTNPDLEGGRISGLDALETSHMMENCHASSLEAFLKGGELSAEHNLSAIAAIPQLRMTRRIDGVSTLGGGTGGDKVFVPDSIGMASDWRFPGPVYEIPFGSLYTESFSNLAACGRAISVCDELWDVTRVIPPCAVTGQAAGTALAMNCDLHSLDVGALQKKLASAGVRLHCGELPDALGYITLRERPELEDAAAEWFSSKWRVPEEAYLECMDAYLNRETEYGWYICLAGDRIVGGLGVIENDFHDRKDLTPNVCAVFTEPEFRCRGIAGRLLNMAVEDMRSKGVSPVYLVTDHTGFYERYGWEFLCMVQGDGEPDLTRMYIHK